MAQFDCRNGGSLVVVAVDKITVHVRSPPFLLPSMEHTMPLPLDVLRLVFESLFHEDKKEAIRLLPLSKMTHAWCVLPMFPQIQKLSIN
jgi:hypothetical protein